MRRSWMVPVAVLGLFGCYVGPHTRTFAPANGPTGIEADLRLIKAKGRVLGEVLEVQDTALVVLNANRVALVPIRVIASGRFRDLGMLIAGGLVSPQSLARVRLLSRFPAGMTPEIRTRLLAVYAQTEPDVVR